MRLVPALSLVLLAGCAATVPRAELDRCTLGVADGNDAMPMRQGAACASVARRLAADEQTGAALGYARKACDLEDPRGCEQYLALVRGQSTVSTDELQRARSAGEKACAGMVIAIDGATDARPTICARTAELYQDVKPASPEDSGRLFARACKLGDDASCAKARSLGVSLTDTYGLGPKPRPNGPAVAQPLPPPGPRPPLPAGPPPAPVPACHEMRTCVSLDVTQRNSIEVVGALENHCDRAVACTWCPAHRDQIDKGACHTANLGPGEKRAGREAGLWYEGYDSMAYDCIDANDAKGCLGI
ncbi:MAG TPA: hypothetical protein VGG39_01170 [Polyangiaceae bacterium]|jgi:hypothetical protein